MLKKKAQSTLEYVIILTAIIAAVIVGVGTIASREKEKGLGKLMNTTTSQITDSTGRLLNSLRN